MFPDPSRHLPGWAKPGSRSGGFDFRLTIVDNHSIYVNHMPHETTSLGPRLRRARIARGLSLDDLVDQAGRIVTKAALSKYERGQAVPRPSVLVQVARALGLPTSHFLGTLDSEETSIQWLAYRKHSRLGARTQERIEAWAEQRVEAFLHLLRLLHPGERPCLPPERPARSASDAEDVALELRSSWGLGRGPIDRLVRIVEDAGVLVIESPVDDRFDALSGRTRSGLAVIVLNLSRTIDRLRFNLAHELGHLLLDGSELEAKEEERLAHRFAAAFLVPSEAAHHELSQHRTNLSTKELEHLKRKYGFSMQAWTYRARDLGIITEAVYRQWQVWFRSQGLHLRETAGYEGDERPQRLRVLCIQALAERVVDPAWIRAHCPEVRDEPGPSTPQSESLIQQLRRLPIEQRNLLLSGMAEEAAADYERDPEVRAWLEFDDPIRDEVEMDA